MPLKIRTGPLASPATLPAVVSTTDPGLRSACACARRAASATWPPAPQAKKDRGSMPSPPRGERSFMAYPPHRRSDPAGRRCRGRGYWRRECAHLQHSAVFFDGIYPRRCGGRPSRIGRPVTVTLSPGLRSLFLTPLRNRVLGPSASKPQSVVVLSSFVTVIHSQECGLVYSNSFTTPFSVMVFSGSNMAPER